MNLTKPIGHGERSDKQDGGAEGGTVIFVKSFRHAKTKKLIIAPPGKAFRLLIRKKSKPKK